ncbi:MAG TPA: hypothetical protein VE572_05440 [Nitrososphaeraceae archaeon]|nr:hypothetical protein [Nitrososphaeraceae archaeon]
MSPGNDYIKFDGCSGVTYGDVQNDELRSFEASVELHGGSGDDKLMGVYKKMSFLISTFAVHVNSFLFNYEQYVSSLSSSLQR